MKHVNFIWSVLAAFLIFNNANSFGQISSWTPYFPVQDSVIGHAFIGNSPLDAKVADLIKNVTLRTHASATSFTKDQQRTTELTWNGFFSKTGFRVAHVEANTVKMDVIDATSLDEMPAGVPFVYAGLRADSCTITFRKSNSIKFNVDSLISSIKEIYPNMTETELGQFISLAKVKYSQKDSGDWKIVIRQPSTYFMIQVAEYTMLENSGGVNWNKVGESFVDLNNLFVDSFILNKNHAPYQTGGAETKFSWRSKGDKATVWLKLEQNGDLAVYYQTGKMIKEKSKVLIEDRGYWIANNIVIDRYAYGSNKYGIKYKDIDLAINAYRKGDEVIIISGAKRGIGPNVLGDTYIYYPEVRLLWKEFSLK